MTSLKFDGMKFVLLHWQEFDGNSFDILVNIELSKTISASEPSLCDPLNESQLRKAGYAAVKISEHRSESPLSLSWSLSEELDDSNNVSAEVSSEDQQVSSVGYTPMASIDLGGHNDNHYHATRLSHSTSIHLDSPLEHEEEGYCEFEDDITIRSCSANGAVVSVVGESREPLNNNLSMNLDHRLDEGYVENGSRKPSLSMNLDCQLANDDEGYVGNGCEKLGCNGDTNTLSPLDPELEANQEDCSVVSELGVSTLLKKGVAPSTEQNQQSFSDYVISPSTLTLDQDIGCEDSGCATASGFVLTLDNVSNSETSLDQSNFQCNELLDFCNDEHCENSTSSGYL